MLSYNLKTGQNTALRGLIAEEFARYVLMNRFPLIVVRPQLILDVIKTEGISGVFKTFLEKYQQTMDYFGICISENDQDSSAKDIFLNFFWQKEGLTRFLIPEKNQNLRGFIIEVKSRTTNNAWAPFNYSFSPNQTQMLDECKDMKIEVILCGVTLENNWNLTITFADRNQKVLAEDFFDINSNTEDGS